MNAKQNQELRHAALEVLAARHPHAFDPAAIRRRISQDSLVDFEFTEDDLRPALAFLEGEGLTEKKADPLGAELFWSATSNGVLAFERGL